MFIWTLQTWFRKEIPNVDQFFWYWVTPAIKALGADYKHELLGERLTTTPKNYAYLKLLKVAIDLVVFCAILMRGKHVSQPIEKLVKKQKD
jgi:ribosomal protein S12 methylthiotransferase